jgi:hypothetical protein
MPTYSRLVTLKKGIAMVVTDLHGEYEPFARLISTFLQLRAEKKVDRLILCGDLLHATEVKDGSLQMILDVMRLQNELGRDTVIMLSGNHELPHIYDVMFSRGDALILNASLEEAVMQAQADGILTREEFKNWLKSLPLYVVTKAGVTISHAGAPNFIQDAEILEAVLTFDHDALLHLGDDMLKQYDLEALIKKGSYKDQVKMFLGITNPKDPAFFHLLRGQLLSNSQPMFKLIWSTLFAGNERNNDIQGYLSTVENFLAHMTTLVEFPQHILIAGHVVTKGGYNILGKQKFRLSSWTHATPKTSGKYLLLDCGKQVEDAYALEKHLYNTWA